MLDASEIDWAALASWAGEAVAILALMLPFIVMVYVPAGAFSTYAIMEPAFPFDGTSSSTTVLQLWPRPGPLSVTVVEADIAVDVLDPVKYTPGDPQVSE